MKKRSQSKARRQWSDATCRRYAALNAWLISRGERAFERTEELLRDCGYSPEKALRKMEKQIRDAERRTADQTFLRDAEKCIQPEPLDPVLFAKAAGREADDREQVLLNVPAQLMERLRNVVSWGPPEAGADLEGLMVGLLDIGLTSLANKTGMQDKIRTRRAPGFPGRSA